MVGKRTNTHYKGISTVEAAVVFPILLMLTLGLIHYAWLFLSAHKITNAARHGARLAIRHVNYPDEVDVEGDVVAMLNKAGITGASVNITPGYASAPRGAEITVTVTVDAIPETGAALLNGISGPLIILPSPSELRASVTMAKEGP